MKELREKYLKEITKEILIKNVEGIVGKKEGRKSNLDESRKESLE